MRALIDSVDVPTRQVVIEARIVETSKTFAQQYGFQWGFAGSMDPSLGTGTGLVFPNRVDVVGGPFDFGPGVPVLTFHMANVLGTFNLDLQLNATETEGLVRVVSAPRVQTQDNVPAEIQSGFQIPFQTRINFTTTVAYVDATLRLAVTPQITESGTVIMDINVQKNEPAVGLAVEGGAGTPLSTRTAHTRLMVRDGGTAVIAGIYQTKENNAQTRLPFLHQIPVLGNLFKTHDINNSHDELLIFITPRIVRALLLGAGGCMGRKIAILGTVALAVVSCKESNRQSSPVDLIVTTAQKLNRIDIKPNAANCNQTIGTVNIQALVVQNTSGTLPTNADLDNVIINQYRVSYVRTDGGTQVPAPFGLMSIRFSFCAVVTMRSTGEL